MIRQIWLASFTAVCLSFPLTVQAEENEGQADLEQAIALKLNAQSLQELSNVITLCEGALKKGLDEDNTSFAKQLLSATLMQRAEAISQVLFNATPQNAQQLQQWQRFRELAANDARKAVEMDPMLAEGNILLGRILALGGQDSAEAIAALDKGLAGDIKDDETKALAYLTRAQLKDDLDSQLSDFSEALKLAPNSAEIHRARGLAYLRAEKLDEALADLDEAIKLDPEHPETYQAKGSVLAALGKLDESKAAFDKAIELQPRSPFAYLQRARILAIQGNVDGAMTEVEKLLLLEPDNIDALLLQATLHQERDDSDKALAVLDRMLNVDENLHEARRLRAAIYAETEQYDKAIEDIDVLRANAGDDPQLLVQLAALYDLAKKPDQVLELYSKAIESDPNTFIAYRGRGDWYLTHGHHKEALADFEKAYSLNDKDSGLLNNLAWLLSTSPEDGIRNGSRAVELATAACELTEFQQSHILSTLASAYAESGNFEKAIEWSTKAVELGSAELKEQLSQELQSYKDGKPWREMLTGNEDDAPANDADKSDADNAATPSKGDKPSEEKSDAEKSDSNGQKPSADRGGESKGAGDNAGSDDPKQGGAKEDKQDGAKDDGARG